MATVTLELLSGSTDGRGIKVVATSSAGTTIHTVAAGTTTKDEIFLDAYNSDSVDRLLTVEFGGTTAPDDNIAVIVPAKGAGKLRVVDGLKLQNGVVVRAFAAAANVVVIFGYVHRVTN